MKDNYPSIGLSRVCRLLGITRQAYYQHFWHLEFERIEEGLILQQVATIRKDHRCMGGRKLYELLQPFILDHQIKMGRDALFDLLAANKLLVRRRRRRVYTTNSFHWLRKYPNLIRGYIPDAPNKLWVSDITYLKITTGFLYISFITDAFSHKIVGYHVAPTLEAVETLEALKMALSSLDGSNYRNELIHHSDRGIQYCSAEYVNLLQDYNIKISMTENGDPLENPVAERVNGILKEEYLRHYQLKDLTQAKEYLKKSVALYNNQRPHMSIGLLTPDVVHQSNLKTEKLWKNRTVKATIVNSFQD
jgi:transposase InsO family protein